MKNLMNSPLLVFVLSFFMLWLSAWIGASLLKRKRAFGDEAREDFGVVLAATLTLLGLIIGFSFSMAIGRYDQRKNYEEAEANAIGTAYVRADLLPPRNAAEVRAQLRHYLGLRILFYQSRREDELRQIDADTARLQGQMWSAVQTSASEQPSPVIALAVAGMNDVLNSQGYTRAAWWNRIPDAAWALVMTMAVCGNLLIGYGERRVKASLGLLLILPVVVSISILLIADIDSPRTGFIHVVPQNLISLSGELK
jgi:hypothetical protein